MDNPTVSVPSVLYTRNDGARKVSLSFISLHITHCYHCVAPMTTEACAKNNKTQLCPVIPRGTYMYPTLRKMEINLHTAG